MFLKQQNYLHSKDCGFTDAGLIAVASGHLAWLPRAEMEASHIHCISQAKESWKCSEAGKSGVRFFNLYRWIVFSSAGEFRK